MIDRPIGYYVHHHGAGHLARAKAIFDAADGRVTLLGTNIGSAGIDLADDRAASQTFDGVDGTGERPNALHYAPLDHLGVRSRVATIAQWIDDNSPSLMVIDVSAEVAMLARLASVPVIYVRLNGDRNDTAHLDAFRGASALLAPFHEDLEADATRLWVRQKTRYFPGITAAPNGSFEIAQNTILVVNGRGGKDGDGAAIAAAATQCPGWHWRVIGPCSLPPSAPPNLTMLGWVDCPEREVSAATLVVGAAGDGLVSHMLATDRPFICLPEDRPFDEQLATARGLSKAGAAVVLSRWPEPAEWSGLIQKALALPGAVRRRLHDPAGATSAAQWLAKMASLSGVSWEQAA